MSIARILLPILLLVCAGCGHSASAGGPSPVHNWINGSLHGWVNTQTSETTWNSSGGGGGGGTNSLLGGGYQYSHDHHLSAELPKSERSPLLVALRGEIEGQVAAMGGNINGRGTTGEPLVGFDLTYDAGATRGNVTVYSVDGEGGMFHIIVVAHEVQ